MDTQLFSSTLLMSEFENFGNDPTGYCLSMGWDKTSKAVLAAVEHKEDINFDTQDVSNLKSIVDSILDVNPGATTEEILESNTLQDFLCNCVAGKIQAIK